MLQRCCASTVAAASQGLHKSIQAYVGWVVGAARAVRARDARRRPPLCPPDVALAAAVGPRRRRRRHLLLRLLRVLLRLLLRQRHACHAVHVVLLVGRRRHAEASAMLHVLAAVRVVQHGRRR